MDVPRPPQADLEKKDQQELMGDLARQILSELWSEPEANGLIARILPYALMVVNLVVLLVIIFKK